MLSLTYCIDCLLDVALVLTDKKTKSETAPDFSLPFNRKVDLFSVKHNIVQNVVMVIK